MRITAATAFLLTTTLMACQPATEQPSTTAADTPARPADAAIEPWSPERWSLPVQGDAAQPDLVATPDGDLLLSWISPDEDGHVLSFARHRDGQWSAPHAIARGDDWFVNWADTPHILATDDGAVWAHWLQKSAASTYAYDVALVRSADGGASWSAPVLVNDDGTPTEHGFVSLWPAGRDRLGIAWLDGRETAGASHDSHDGGHDGPAGHAPADAAAMTLRTAVFDPVLARSGETRIDAMTCDCCQTDTAVTAHGPLLVYRDRSAAEIRDIAATRFQDGRWTEPAPVHADGWTMPACPVNGPAVDAVGDAVLVGWYTAANDEPSLRLARSDDAGDHFSAPLELDRGAHVQGRVDVVLAGGSAWALWTREDGSGQSLQLARLAPDLSEEWQRFELARLQGRGRGTGFAQLAMGADGTLHVVWTDVVNGAPRLHGARIRLAG